MVKREELLGKLAEIVKESNYLIFEETNWKLLRTSKSGVKIYKCPAPNNRDHATFKAEFSSKCSPEKMFDMIHPKFDYYKCKWDVFGEKCDIVEELDRDIVLQHSFMKKAAGGLIAPRDSIDIVRFVDTKDYKAVIIGSVEHDGYPPVKDYIRSWSHPSAAYVFPTSNPNECLVKVLFQADINTKFTPQAVFDAATPKMLNQYSKTLQATDKIDWTPLTDVEGRRPASFVVKA